MAAPTRAARAPIARETGAFLKAAAGREVVAGDDEGAEEGVEADKTVEVPGVPPGAPLALGLEGRELTARGRETCEYARTSMGNESAHPHRLHPGAGWQRLLGQGTAVQSIERESR